MTLTATTTMQITSKITSTSNLVSGTGDVDVLERVSLTDGSGDNQAELLATQTGTVNSESTVSVDLTGSLTDVFGNSITLASVKALFIRNTSDELTTPTDAILHVGGGSDEGGTNAFSTWITAGTADGSEAIIIPAGAAFMLSFPGDGYTVTPSTGDLLGIHNQDTSDQAQYDLVVIGVSS